MCLVIVMTMEFVRYHVETEGERVSEGEEEEEREREREQGREEGSEREKNDGSVNIIYPTIIIVSVSLYW